MLLPATIKSTFIWTVVVSCRISNLGCFCRMRRTHTAKIKWSWQISNAAYPTFGGIWVSYRHKRRSHVMQFFGTIDFKFRLSLSKQRAGGRAMISGSHFLSMYFLYIWVMMDQGQNAESHSGAGECVPLTRPPLLSSLTCPPSLFSP